MATSTRLIACEVFRPALEYLRLEDRYPHVYSIFLPSNLHLRPQDLRNFLSTEIRSAKRRDERVLCLYGNCVPDMDVLCRRHGVVKIPGLHCFEMLLGSERYQDIIKEIPGTYFLERDLILNFEEYCLHPLELNEEEMRTFFFGRYEKMVYIRQPSDSDLVSRAAKLAEFLHMSLEIHDADYSKLERILLELL